MQYQFAQKAVIERDGRILLVRKSANDPHNPQRWELPGGRLKSSEGLDEAIVREVSEETGLVIVPGPPLYLWDWEMEWDSETVRVIAVARHCEARDQGSAHRETDDYIDNQQWFTPAEAVKLNLIPTQIPIMTILIDMIPSDRPKEL